MLNWPSPRDGRDMCPVGQQLDPQLKQQPSSSGGSVPKRSTSSAVSASMSDSVLHIGQPPVQLHPQRHIRDEVGRHISGDRQFDHDRRCGSVDRRSDSLAAFQPLDGLRQ